MNLEREQNTLSKLATKRKWTERENEQSLRDLWNYKKRSRICVTGVPENSRMRVDGKIQELMPENFPDLARNINLQNEEVE